MKNGIFFILTLVLILLQVLSGEIKAQCTIDPSKVKACASGTFIASQTNSTKQAIAMLMDNGYGYASLALYRFNGNISNIPISTYSVAKFGDRMVSGRFINDNYCIGANDVAAFYDNGNGTITIHLWTITDVSNEHTTSWSGPFDASKIKKIVSGNFDRSSDNIDDIAVLYDCGSGVTKIYVFKSNGNGTFTLSLFWDSTPLGGYFCNYVGNRFVAGDFDRDGKYDDLATFYDYGNGAMRIHVFLSTGTSFAYQGAGGWWSTPSGYPASYINGRIVSLNFDKSGLFDHKSDDIVALYDYGNGNVKVHVWANNGNSFNYYWRWERSGFYATNVTGRLTDFNQSGGDRYTCFDMAGLYNYGSTTDKYYHWRNTNDDFASGLDYFCSKAPITNNTNELLEIEENDGFIIYPNPSDGNFSIEYESLKPMEIIIMNSMGAEVYRCKISDAKTDINLSNLTPGLYFVNGITTDGYRSVKKLIIK